MTDDREGLSSEDLIRQARERIQGTDEALSSEEMARGAMGDVEAPDEPRHEHSGPPTPPPKTPDTALGGFTMDELSDLSGGTEPTPRSPRSQAPHEFEASASPLEGSEPNTTSTLGQSTTFPGGPVGAPGGDSSADSILLGGRRGGTATTGTAGRQVGLLIVALVVGVFAAGIAFLVVGDVTESTSATSLAVGDCLLEPDSDEFASVSVVACGEPHDYEVFALTSLSGSTYPGDLVILEEAFAQCEPLFEPYVGRDYATSKWYIDTFVPAEDLWNDGNRDVRCALYEPGAEQNGIAQASGSARNSGE